ncbi:type II toxin-antitoxin system VapC family toxin [Mesorhizobium sp. CN2-181]|uniref:type II toxin-antitoxin system VapC family toxin n=1 Tax=Mesorhizobium yinganensis TaxID=3157707 RepID=UPI0032B79FAD
MFLLDTNVVSELRKASTAQPGVAAWAESVSLHEMFISVVTILEIERGILHIARRDRRQGEALQGWLHQTLIARFSGRVLDIAPAIALCCAALHVPDPRPELDALIAATGLVHDLTIVTRNTRDFEGTGAKLFNPWEA